jgi:hypothetical protein
MSTIPINFTDEGFNPSSASAMPGDTITITNDTKNDIELTFTCSSTTDPLEGLTSPAQVTGSGGMVEGRVRPAASNHAIIFSANGYDCPVEVGPATVPIYAYTDYTLPAGDIYANVSDNIWFQNETNDSVTLTIGDEAGPDPFGSNIGMEPTIATNPPYLVGTVQRSAQNKKVKVTVKGSTSTPTSVNVGSGDDTSQSGSRQSPRQTK